MDENLEKEKNNLVSYFDKTGTDYWKTISDITAATKIDPNIIMKIITTSGDFVRSSYRQKNGEPLFTTRKMFRHKAPFVDRLIGAFKNRID